MIKKITKLGFSVFFMLGLMNAKAQPFITEWNLATSGSGSTQLTFNVSTTGIVAYNWAATSSPFTTGTGTFTGSTAVISGLPASATISLSITSTNFKSFYIFNGMDKSRLTNVVQWGDVAWSSMATAFYGCNNLQITASDAPNLSGVTDLSYMFYKASSFNKSLNNWNTASVTSMRGMFSGASAFNNDISSWNTGSVTDMNFMFQDAVAFNSDLGTWNTGNVTGMAYMFSNAQAFNSDISYWNTSNVISMSNMFSGAKVFNQDLRYWNTSKVTDMSFMFRFAFAFNQPIELWNVSSVTNMSYMLNTAIAFNQSLGGLGTSLRSNANLSNMLDYSKVSISNYAATLQGFAGGTATGVTFGAANLSYCDGSVARTNLVSSKGWNIVSDYALQGTNIITLPVSQTICGGNMATFSVSATGSNLSYAWSNGNSNVDTMSTSITGNYVVTVSGVCGNIVSNPFNLAATFCGTNVVVFPNNTTTTFTGTSANLVWPPLVGAATYCIRYSKTSDFSTTVKTVCGLNAANYQFVLSSSGLRTEAADETIYYQVAGVDVLGNMSLWSTVQSFILRQGNVTAVNQYDTEGGDAPYFYPNPTQGNWTVQSNPGSVLEVYNSLGTLVYAQKMMANKTLINANLPSGIYLVKIGSDIMNLVVE